VRTLGLLLALAAACLPAALPLLVGRTVAPESPSLVSAPLGHAEGGPACSDASASPVGLAALGCPPVAAVAARAAPLPAAPRLGGPASGDPAAESRRL
jgi:hypothetical protein